MDTTASTSTDKASADPVRSEAAAKTVDEDSEKADAEKIEPSQVRRMCMLIHSFHLILACSSAASFRVSRTFPTLFHG